MSNNEKSKVISSSEKYEISELYDQYSEFKHNIEKNNEKKIYEFNLDQFDEPEMPGWPKLSEDALYGLAGRFVKLATEKSEADPAAVLATFLTGFGVECGSNPYLMVGDTRHYARIFAAIVGASSKARKGTSGKPVQRLFNKNEVIKQEGSALETWKPARHSPGPLSSGEGIINSVKAPQTEYKINKQTNIGEEIIIDPGVEDKRLFILDEEFASALSSTKREGNTLSAILRGAWDNGDIDPLTKTSKISTTGAHIGICTHITMGELHYKLNDTEVLNGFANRFLWCCARRSKIVPFPEPIPKNSLLLLQKQLFEIIKYTHGVGEMRLSADSKKIWGNGLYQKLTRDNPGLFGTVINRGEAQVLRIAMIYALLDQSALIDPSHLKAAYVFWKYCEASAKLIFSSREACPIAEKILNFLKTGPKSRTELYDLFYKRIKKLDLEFALRELNSQGKIISKKYPGNGRATIKYEISPETDPVLESGKKESLSFDF